MHFSFIPIPWTRSPGFGNDVQITVSSHVANRSSWPPSFESSTIRSRNFNPPRFSQMNSAISPVSLSLCDHQNDQERYNYRNRKQDDFDRTERMFARNFTGIAIRNHLVGF